MPGTKNAPSPTAPRPAARPGLILALLSLAQLMVVLDFSIVAVALPDIRRDLGFTEAGLQWVISAYGLANSGFLLLGGRAADLYGRRRLLIWGLGLFTLASLVGGFAWDPTTLVAMRILQGLGGAAIVPAVLSIVTTTFEEEAARNRAIGILGTIAAIGFSLGMVLGGVITERWGWAGVFWVNVPIGVLMMAALPFVVPERRDAAQRGTDIPGAVSVTLGLILTAHGIAELGKPTAESLGALAAGAVLLAVFIGIERRAAAPMLPLGIFANRAVSAATVLEFLAGAAVAPMVFLLTLYFQGMAGYGPLQTGLAFLPHGLAAVVLMGPISRIITRFGPRPVTLAALAVYAVGVAPFLLLTPESGYVRDLLPALLVTAPALMAAFTAIFVIGSAAVGPGEQGLVSGLLGTTQQIGASLGLALVAAMMGETGNLRPGFIAVLVLAASALLLAAVLLPRRRLAVA